MTRGTFANVRIKNLMVPGTEGGVTKFSASTASGRADVDLRRGDEISEGECAADHSGRARIRHRLVARLGGERNALLGVKAVVAASFERIHRSNLVGMGVLPLQFAEGTNAQSLKLDGSETFSITGLSDAIQPGQKVTLEIERARRQDAISPGEAANRYADRNRLLPARRNSAVRPAPTARQQVRAGRMHHRMMPVSYSFPSLPAVPDNAPQFSRILFAGERGADGVLR